MWVTVQSAWRNIANDNQSTFQSLSFMKPGEKERRGTRQLLAVSTWTNDQILIEVFLLRRHERDREK
jgi:hypothetical protein